MFDMFVVCVGEIGIGLLVIVVIGCVVVFVDDLVVCVVFGGYV